MKKSNEYAVNENGMAREENVNAFKDTEKQVKGSSKLKNAVANSSANQKLILETDEISVPDKDRYQNTAEVIVSKKRTLEAASGYKGLNICVHNFASATNPGGVPEAIEDLALQIFADPNAAIETILVLNIPGVRAYMHLDTVFTQVDRDTFVIHPGILPAMSAVTLERGGKTGLRIREQDQPLARVLAKLLDLPAPAKLLFCGGQDAIAAQREQWNDGANTLCLSPGVVVTYDRNQVTNRLLEDNGIRVLSIPSSELSRGRGGPRCMSMPLVREAQM